MTFAASPFPHARRRTIAVPGGTIAGLEFGPPDRPLDIVFLNANGFNAGTYATILAPLGEDLRILAVDLRGHGHTTLPADPESQTNWIVYRDDLLALLNALGETPTVLAGHSMGGTTCLLAAAVRPDAARRLVLFDPVVMTPERLAEVGDDVKNSPLVQGALRRRSAYPDRDAAFKAYQGRGAFRTWPDASLRDYLADGLIEGDDGQVHLACAPAWEAANFAGHDHDTLGAFMRAPVPVRVLRAELASPCLLGDHEAEILAGGKIQLETVPGTSHFLPMERPDLVRSALRTAAA
ncbi:MAG: alpha/beta hydrolase [Caulobacter sp.]|nr:alpha/beta hydrolase [Caulobacter sp.]